MLRWNALDEVPPGFGPSAVTIGVFDGVHLGHRELVSRAVAAGRELGVPAVVITFDPHPATVVRPEAVPLRISTLEHRLELLAELGVDAVLVLPFTRKLSTLTAEEFVRQVLVDDLHARHVVVGADFRFGHRAAGDMALLRRLGAAYGFSVDGVDLVGDERGGRVSSSAVRESIAAGEVEAAAAALGRPHRVEGLVVHGDHRGRELGYPTANLDTPALTAVPADGVYAGYLTSESYGCLPAAISIGTNPTFDGVARRVEAYVLDRDDLELYGQEVRVDVTARLRATLRFDRVSELVAQMEQDVAAARKLTLKDR